MADNVPTVPSIQAPQVAPVSQSGAADVIGQIAAQANAPLPSPYSQGTQLAQPRSVPNVPQFTTGTPVRPTGTNPQQQQTKKNNGIGSLLSLVGGAVNKIEQNKQDRLKDDIKNVMSAKQNVANAQQVLQQDPNNKIAQGVLAANKKQLEAILTDPKKAKQIQKAMDISFTDMDKNKTPEIKAFQEAVKEHKAAGAFNSDNPAEHQVAQLASKGASDGNAPKPVAQPQAQPQQPAQAQPAARSATPYADAALAKDQKTIENNPQYAAALAQKQAAQKQLTQYVIPKMIQAESAAQMQAIKEGNTNARAEYKAATDLQKQYQGDIAKAALADANNAAAMRRVAMRNANSLAETTMKVNASLKIADDNRLGKENQTKIKTDALGAVDKDINTVNQSILAAGKKVLDINASAATPQQKQEQLKQVELQKKMDTDYLMQLQKMRASKFNLDPNAPPETKETPSSGSGVGSGIANFMTQLPTALLGDSNGNDKSAGDADLESVGSDDSDESGGDDDEANYGH